LIALRRRDALAGVVPAVGVGALGTGSPTVALSRSDRQESPMAISKEPLDILVCPVSKGALELTADGKFLVCRESKLVYRVEDDIPIMLADEAIPLEEWERQQRGGA
jgi:uncharacterized protein YbaR (Trm112 family)